jgi:hypothetical protein
MIGGIDPRNSARRAGIERIRHEVIATGSYHPIREKSAGIVRRRI